MTPRLKYLFRFGSLYDLFGDNPHTVYRELAKLLHPDINKFEEATEFFQILQGKYAEAQDLIESNLYPNDVDFEITVGENKYSFFRTFKRGDISTLYLGYDQFGGKVLAKFPLCPDYNCLIQSERSAIDKIHRARAKLLEVEPNCPDFVPRLLNMSDNIGDGLSINIFNYYGGYYTLTEIVARAGLLDSRHIAWIWNKILLALSVAESCNVIHGAITPENILINPVTHDVLLVGWSFSVNLGQVILAQSPLFAGFYPKEWNTKPSFSTDIYMGAACIESVCQKKSLDKRMYNHLSSCLISGTAFRRDNALEVYGQFNSILKEVFGERKFVELVIK